MTTLWIYSICGEMKYDNTLNIFYLWWNKIWQHSEYILFVVKEKMSTLWIYSTCNERHYKQHECILGNVNRFRLWKWFCYEEGYERQRQGCCPQQGM